jgi:Kazal-type serine protease inhibitor-like protein
MVPARAAIRGTRRAHRAPPARTRASRTAGAPAPGALDPARALVRRAGTSVALVTPMRTTAIGLVTALMLALGAAIYGGMLGCVEQEAGAAPRARKLPPPATPPAATAPAAATVAATATATSVSLSAGDVHTDRERNLTVEISHAIVGGRIYDGQRIAGADAFTLRRGRGLLIDSSRVGKIARKKLAAFVQSAIEAGVLKPGDHGTAAPSPELTEYFTIASGGVRASYMARPGALPAQVQKVIASFELLFLCGEGDGDALTCGTGFTCGAGACVPADESCFCGDDYAPVCGTDGQSYSNACRAGCAGVEAATPGTCTALGAMCGGVSGYGCDPGQKCRYEPSTWQPPYPQAAGQCVASDYCDASSDCGVRAGGEPGSHVCQDSVCESVTAAR